MDLSSTVSEIKLVNNNCQIVPLLVNLTSLLRQFPLEFCNTIGDQKN